MAITAAGKNMRDINFISANGKDTEKNNAGRKNPAGIVED